MKKKKRKKEKKISTLTGLLIITAVIIVIEFVVYGILYNYINTNNSNTNNDLSFGENEGVEYEHIMSSKVLKIYDLIKIRKYKPGFGADYYNTSYSLDFINKIEIVLGVENIKTSAITLKQYNELYEKYEDTIDKYYYIKLSDFINTFKTIFNFSISEEDLISLGNKVFDVNTKYIYDSSIKGFLEISTSKYNEFEHITQVYSYIYTNGYAKVKEIVVFGKRLNKDSDNTEKIYDLYTDINSSEPLYTNINIDEFKVQKEDLSKFIQIEYTFKRKDDGSYYFVNVEKIN